MPVPVPRLVMEAGSCRRRRMPVPMLVVWAVIFAVWGEALGRGLILCQEAVSNVLCSSDGGRPVPVHVIVVVEGTLTVTITTPITLVPVGRCSVSFLEAVPVGKKLVLVAIGVGSSGVTVMVEVTVVVIIVLLGKWKWGPLDVVKT